MHMRGRCLMASTFTLPRTRGVVIKRHSPNRLASRTPPSLSLNPVKVGCPSNRLEKIFREGGIIVSGRIEITVDDKRKISGPRDAYYLDSKSPRQFRQVGQHPCVLVNACTT
ncbi:MAG: cupin domain-containing protein [Pseudoruegeria sp.]